MKRTTSLCATLALIGALLILSGCPSNTSTPGGGGGMGGGGGRGDGSGGGRGDGSGGGRGDGSGGGRGDGSGGAAAGSVPSFSLAWSEYPSWSVFGVAHVNNIIDGAEGKQGPVEKKWNVDIVLKQLDYDPCIQAYGSATVDAVCITNMDVLSPCLGRDSVAILPTSTSDGADACIVVGIDDVDQLQKAKVYGLAKTVSEYCFARNLELSGKKDTDYQFTNMDPAAAAQAMQTGQEGYEAIMVWNPFVLQTLKTVPDAKVLFDSTKIPGEIIDMVVVAKDSLNKSGGKDFACAVIDAYYELNKMLANPQHADETLVELGRKFSSLGLEEMKVVVEQTKFYDTPEKGLEAMATVLPENMGKVVDFCVSHQIVDKQPKVVFAGGEGDAATAQLLFDPSFIEQVKAKP